MLDTEKTIDAAALAASKLTRLGYESQGYHIEVMSYELARLAAQDRGLALCWEGPARPQPPDNVGLALLLMIREMQADAAYVI